MCMYLGQSMNHLFIDIFVFSVKICCNGNGDGTEEQLCMDDGKISGNVKNNGLWKSAEISQSDKTSVTISWEKCKETHVYGLRYLWKDAPCEYKKCAIYSVENELPGPPFISVGICNEPDYGKSDIVKINAANTHKPLRGDK